MRLKVLVTAPFTQEKTPPHSKDQIDDFKNGHNWIIAKVDERMQMSHILLSYYTLKNVPSTCSSAKQYHHHLSIQRAAH